jgi:hypothetical protein
MSGNFLLLWVQVGLTPGQHEGPDAKKPDQNQLLEKTPMTSRGSAEPDSAMGIARMMNR